MEVDVRHRPRRARQTRLIEVVDVARRLVEQVEDLQGQGETGGEVVAEAGVDQGRGVGADARVLDQGTGPFSIRPLKVTMPGHLAHALRGGR